MDLLQGKSLLQKGSEVVSADVALKKKTLILFYFSSYNSEACRIFDLKLKEVYLEALNRKVEMAVIIVPGDMNKELHMNNVQANYLEWFSVQYEDELSHILVYSFGITHVPSVIVVTKNGALITREGVKDIENIGINVLVTWTE